MQDQEQEGKKRRLPEDMRGVVEKRERAAQKMAAWQGSRAGAWPSWSLLHPSRLRLPTLCWLATWMRTPPSTKHQPHVGWLARTKQSVKKMRAAVFGRGAPGSHDHGTASRAWRGLAEWPAPDIDLQWRHVGMGLDSTAAIRRRHHGHGLENRCVRLDKTRRAGSRGGRGCAASCVNGGPTANWQRGNSTHAVVDGARASARRPRLEDDAEVGGGFVDT